MRLAVGNLLIGSVVIALAMDGCMGPDTPSADASSPASGEARLSPEAQAVLDRQTARETVKTTGWGVQAERAPDGHFYLDGHINGRAQRFLMDTGASTIALGRREARDLGLFVTENDFLGMSETAAGPVRIAPVTLREVRIGGLSATDVPAAVVDTPTLQPLLGQSFLSRLGSVRIEGDQLTLR